MPAQNRTRPSLCEPSTMAPFVCDICTDEVQGECLFARRCSGAHQYCVSCWRTYAGIEAQLHPGARIRCMNPYCSDNLSAEELSRLGVGKRSTRPGAAAPPCMDNLSLEWARQRLRLCPRCLVPIEKNGGCAQMRCVRCKHRFHWGAARRFDTPPGSWKHTLTKLKVTAWRTATWLVPVLLGVITRVGTPVSR